MKISLRIFLLLLCILRIQIVSSAQSVDSRFEKTFSIAELQKDFIVLKQRYENNLGNLYLYTEKRILDKSFDSLYQNIHPMTSLEFYTYTTPLSSLIKDGHSNLYPGKGEVSFYNQQARFFPFAIFWSEGKLFITLNLSEDTSIAEGSEIKEINGMRAADVMDYLLKRQVRDGYNENYPNWILNNYFREYFSYHFGHPENFKLKVSNGNTAEVEINIKALSKKQIASNYVGRYPVPYAIMIDPVNFSFVIDSLTNVAIFKIKTWDDNKLDHQIEEAFGRMKAAKTENLIIDLRDNQGGNFQPAILLLSYLLDSNFEYFKEIKSVNKNKQGEQRLKTESGKMLGLNQSKQNSYKGNLYVLINGGSFSNTASFCSKIKFYKRGVFLGSETGGNAVVFSGVFGLKSKTILPNTKIICDNSNYQLVVTNLDQNTGHGVIPEYTVHPDIHTILKGEDFVLHSAIELIKSKR